MGQQHAMGDIDADPPGTFGTRQMKAAVIEFIATALFTFVGGASVSGSGKLSADEMTVDRVIGISICHGLAFICLSIMVRVLLKSGGDDGLDPEQGFMNPAYCMAAAAVGRVNDNTTKGVGSLGGTFVQKGLGQGSALVMEVMLSLILFYVMFSV